MRPQLTNSPMQQLPTHALGLTLVATSLLGGYLLGLKPWRDSEQLLRQTRDDNAQLHANAATIEARIRKVSNDIESKQTELKRLHSIPSDPNQPLIELVSRMLEQHTIKLSSLREDNSSPNGSTTLSLQISGRYTDLLELMSQLRQLERPARITSLTLTPTDGSGEFCDAKLSVSFASARDIPQTGDSDA